SATQVRTQRFPRLVDACSYATLVLPCFCACQQLDDRGYTGSSQVLYQTSPSIESIVERAAGWRAYAPGAGPIATCTAFLIAEGIVCMMVGTSTNPDRMDSSLALGCWGMHATRGQDKGVKRGVPYAEPEQLDAVSCPGPSTPSPAKRTKAEQAAEPIQPTKGKGKGKVSKPKSAPQPGRQVDRDCNAAGGAHWSCAGDQTCQLCLPMARSTQAWTTSGCETGHPWLLWHSSVCLPLSCHRLSISAGMSCQL
ncbi:hypothetical protein HaLaN_26076, partial [Haematococcus lacustris]